MHYPNNNLTGGEKADLRHEPSDKIEFTNPLVLISESAKELKRLTDLLSWESLKETVKHDKQSSPD